MKKVFKYFFITLVSLAILFIVAVFAVLVMFAGKDHKSSERIKEFTGSAMTQIITYHNKHGSYPKSLEDIPLYKDKEFAVLQKEHQIRYNSYGENRSKYSFSWRGGALNWTGYSCTNDGSNSTKDTQGLVGTYIMPNETVCTVTDLH